MKITVLIGTKSIDGDKTIEVDHILDATHMKSRLAHLLLYAEQFSDWQYAEWEWEGHTQYLFKEEA